MPDIVNPEHVVVVGASDDPSNIGQRFVRALDRSAFPGRVSVVHPTSGPVLGYPVHRTLGECPQPIGHVIVAVSGRPVLQVLQDAVAAGARSVHLFAGGFAEASEEGAAFQAELREVVRGTQTRVIGPNCMGIHRPSRGLTFRDDLPMRSGWLGVIAQSGGVAIATIRRADARQVGISTAISYGNGVDINASDALVLLADDPQTEVISLYLESANDERIGPSLSYASERKPVVVWAVGASQAGLAAGVHHTGAPGGPLDADAVPNRCILVDRMDDLVDVALVQRYIGADAVTGVAYASISGGFAVASAVEAEAHQLPMPVLGDKSLVELGDLYGPEAGNLTNPLDLGGAGYLSRGRLGPLMEVLDRDPSIGTAVFHLAWDYVEEAAGRVPGYRHRYLDALRQAIEAVELPVIVHCPDAGDPLTRVPACDALREHGVLVIEDATTIWRGLGLCLRNGAVDGRSH